MESTKKVRLIGHFVLTVVRDSYVTSRGILNSLDVKQIHHALNFRKQISITIIIWQLSDNINRAKPYTLVPYKSRVVLLWHLILLCDGGVVHDSNCWHIPDYSPGLDWLICWSVRIDPRWQVSWSTLTRSEW